MISKSHLTDFYNYSSWATGRAIASIATVPGESPRVQAILNHILGAEIVWFLRFTDQSAAQAFTWPGLTTEEAKAEFESMNTKWHTMLAGLTDADLGKKLTYNNLSGEEFSNSIGSILMHIANHGTYHRGQLATAVREAGGTPAVTDYIAYAREIGE